MKGLKPWQLFSKLNHLYPGLALLLFAQFTFKKIFI